MKVEKTLISKTFPDPNNARTHNQKNIQAIMGSLTKFGQQKPIVVDEGGIVLAGNGTREAALQLGWTDIYVVRSTLSEWKATAYALADNRTAELAEWDNDILDSQLMTLGEIPEIDLSDIGFDDIGDWDSDLDSVENTKDNLDGISATIKCEVDQDIKDDFKDWLVSMVKGSGYNVKIT